jgi:hypothetical protein
VRNLSILYIRANLSDRHVRADNIDEKADAVSLANFEVCRS